MKKLLFIALMIGFVSADAQQLIVTTPSTSIQSFGSGFISGFDSVGEATTKQTIPSSYFTFNHQISMAANKKLTDTIVLPASPVQGQKVLIVSNKAFYHLFTTSPKFVQVDTAGSQEAVLIYSGKNWQLVH